mmetsp:Transcript_30262/g.87942  ORF Transcript_30262/g.87942 Transcript_30262/m.87942 type:complete len:240 (+) Transcript_30262:978-1697(+)
MHDRQPLAASQSVSLSIAQKYVSRDSHRCCSATWSLAKPLCEMYPSGLQSIHAPGYARPVSGSLRRPLSCTSMSHTKSSGSASTERPMVALHFCLIWSSTRLRLPPSTDGVREALPGGDSTSSALSPPQGLSVAHPIFCIARTARLTNITIVRPSLVSVLGGFASCGASSSSKGSRHAAGSQHWEIQPPSPMVGMHTVRIIVKWFDARNRCRRTGRTFSVSLTSPSNASGTLWPGRRLP